MQFPIESLNLQMLNVGYARQNGDWNWQGVTSPFSRIYLVTEGEARLHLPNKVVLLRPMHLYVIPAYTTHSYECHGVFGHYYLHLYEGFKNQTNIIDMFEFPTEVQATEVELRLFQEMCRRHPEMLLPESDPQAYDTQSSFDDYARRYNALSLWEKMQLRGAMLMLVSLFVQHATPRIWTTDERMTKVLTHIHDHLYENIGIDSLADVACITKSYLIRLFKQELGCPPLSYINRKKIEKSQLMLLTTNQPVKEIAYALGFNDCSYFIRLFKKSIGVTPNDYRLNMR